MRPTLAILDDVERLADLQGRIKEMTAEADSIKARLRDDYRDDPGTKELGDHKLSVTPTARFSEDQARAALDALRGAGYVIGPAPKAGELRA